VVESAKSGNQQNDGRPDNVITESEVNIE